MKLGVMRTQTPGERRVAATPEVVKQYIKAGHRCIVEPGAGEQAAYADQLYEQAGAQLGDPYEAQVLLPMSRHDLDFARVLPIHTVVGILDPYDQAGIQALTQTSCQAFSLELIPRTTRAQSMDVLSSQANIAGYAAVLRAAAIYPRFFPMMMTAAGTVKAARVVVLGAGVAGLQAIATARRLGAVVEASDVRPAAREQIASLGARFIDVPYETQDERLAAEGKGGYAGAMPASWLERQAQVVAQRCIQADILISTALIPGRPAPRLIAAEVVEQMRPGSVIVDLAAPRGGNCALTQPGKTVVQHGVSIVGELNFPALVAADASALYARNVYQFLALLTHSEDASLSIPSDDDIVQASLICAAGTQIFPASERA